MQSTPFSRSVLRANDTDAAFQALSGGYAALWAKMEPFAIPADQQLTSIDVTTLTREHSKPYKGVSSYYIFGSVGTESNFLWYATNFVAAGMLTHGYDWFWFTSGWQLGRTNNMLGVNTTNFPNHVTNTLAVLHRMGFKCGAALLGAADGSGQIPGSVGYQSNDIVTLRDWGFDGVVIDNSHNTNTTISGLQLDYELFIYWKNILAPNLLLVGNYFDPYRIAPDPLLPAAGVGGIVATNHVSRIAPWQVRNNNSTTYTEEWGVGGGSMFSQICAHADLVYLARGYIGPGRYIWPGDLITESFGANSNTKTALSLWSILHAPLGVGTMLWSPWASRPTMFTNQMMLDIDDDSLASPADIVFDDASGNQVWRMKCANGDTVLCFLNRTSTTNTVSPSFDVLGFRPSEYYLTTNVWTGVSEWWKDSISVSVQPTNCELFRVNGPRAFDPDVRTKSLWRADDAQSFSTAFVVPNRIASALALTNLAASTTWPTVAFDPARNHAALTFDGTNDYLVAKNYTNASSHTVMIVGRYNAVRDASFHQFFDGYPTTYRHGGGQNSSGNLYLVQGGGSLIDGPLQTNQVTLWEFYVGAADAAIYTNGAAAVAGTTLDSTAMSGFTLGNYGDLGATAPANLSVFEVRTVDGKLNSAERAGYLNYVTNRYGVLGTP